MWVVLIHLVLLVMNNILFRTLVFCILLIVTSCKVNKKILSDLNDQEYVFIAIDKFIQDSTWINRTDTLLIKPYQKISKTSCTTYGYYNFNLVKLREQNKEVDLILYKEISKNVDRIVKVDFNCIGCQKIFEISEDHRAFTFSPLLKLTENKFWIFAYRNVHGTEIGYHFALHKKKDHFKVVGFFYLFDCYGYETDSDLIGEL